MIHPEMCDAFPPKGWDMFAHRMDDGERLHHVQPTSQMVALYGRGEVVAVDVREIPSGSDATHYGWLEVGAKTPSMIWPSMVQLEMCFPYGMKAEVDRGRGRCVMLAIEEK